MIGSLGWQELLIILVILALLFGANRVAGLGGALGRGIREFRSEARNSDTQTETETDSTTSTTSTSAATPPTPAEQAEEQPQPSATNSPNPPTS